MKTAQAAVSLLSGASLLGSVAIANAAEPIGALSWVQGAAVVSQGAQYVKGREGMALREGDRLMVMEGGTATISFADGCEYTLKDNELLTIGAVSTCTSDAVGSYKVDPYAGVSQDPSVAAQGFTPAALGEPSAPSSSPYNEYWPPALAGLVFIGAAAGTSGGDDDDGFKFTPPSP